MTVPCNLYVLSTFSDFTQHSYNVVFILAQLDFNSSSDMLRDPGHSSGSLLSSRVGGGIHGHDSEGKN